MKVSKYGKVKSGIIYIYFIEYGPKNQKDSHIELNWDWWKRQKSVYFLIPTVILVYTSWNSFLLTFKFLKIELQFQLFNWKPTR